MQKTVVSFLAILSLALLPVIGPANAALWDFIPSQLNLSGYLKNETAYRYREPRSFTKMRNIFSLDVNYPISERFEVSASGWAYYDMVYDLFDYDVIAARTERESDQPLNFIEALDERKDSPEAAIRELYLDSFLGDFDIRIGKQFIIWGVMTGIRIVDEINPMDFREMIAPDLLDYRIPLWSLKVDYYGQNNAYQLVVIPDLEFHEPAPAGSEWELLQKVPGTSFPNSWTIDNTEVGARVTRTVWDTELSLSYFYTWDDFPVIFRRLRTNNTVQEDPVFFPTYTRIHMYGSTFQRSLFGQVLKGEFAYVTNKYFGISNDVDEDGDGFVDNEGEVQKNHIRWGLGLDFNLWKTDFSPGIVQWIILDYDEAIIQDEFDTSFNFFIRKELPQHGAVFEALGIWPVNMSEFYLAPEITFSVTERFQVSGGMNIFWGENSRTGIVVVDGRATDILEVDPRFRFFGNFDKNDRVFMTFKYSF